MSKLSKVSGFSAMSLPTKKYEILGASVELKALSFSNITGLISSHRKELDALFDSATSDKDTDMADMLFDGLSNAPELAVSIIAYSSGQVGEEDIISSIPFPAQIEMLEIIADLTFNEVGGVGKFLPMVVRIFKKASSSISSLV